MELTGQLYGFYSNKKISSVFEELKKYAKSTDYLCEHNTYDDEESLFFFKDEEMKQYHEEEGYNTDQKSQGCFCVEAKMTKLDGISTLFEFEGSSDFDPIDINLVFTKVYYYVLTVPHFLENDKFSKTIFDSMHRILMKA